LDCLIVGGGVIGLSLAWQLAERGKKVQVIDRGEIGREASWAGAGILPPANRHALAHPLDQLRGLSFDLHREWAETLREQTGIDTGYRRCGGIYLARAAGEAAALSAWAATQVEEGVVVERLDAANLKDRKPNGRPLAELEPAIASNLTFRAAWYLPDECQLRNPWYLRALRRMCELRGVEIVPQCEVVDWNIAGERVQGVQTSLGPLHPEQICVTSGAWSGGVLQKAGITLGVMPIRGQIVLFRTERPLARSIVNEGPRYLVPREDGRLLAGATEEEVGFDKRNTEEAVRDLINFATSLLPPLRSAEIELTWAGLRPASFDGFPYLGQVPGLRNLYVAAGHFRSGIYLSPGTAVVMAEHMCGTETSLDLAPFRVGR
jgi:glycine oxidase